MSDAPTKDHPSRQTPLRFGAAVENRDYIVIGGVELSLNEILNEDFLAPKKIKELSDTFSKNTPFPHLVFENLFSPKLLELMHNDFEALKWTNWRHYDNANELKRGSMPNTRFGSATQLYFNTIYSGIFLKFLTDVTGVNGLVTDPEFHGGGLHDIPSGGKFGMHVDFNQHPITKLANRFVLITYLNKDWAPSYGGALELWDIDEQACKVQVEPTFGRTVIFYQSSRSLHGHPKPVNTPNGRTRRSAAAYFYTNGRTDEESDEFHTTLFPVQIKLSQRDKAINAAKYLLPPVVFDAGRKLKAMLGR
jgi:Rps23 Pro-64 3,4-dihydroxylase Tpa1-like proline 4-hydroxylase